MDNHYKCARALLDMTHREIEELATHIIDNVGDARKLQHPIDAGEVTDWLLSWADAKVEQAHEQPD